MAMFNSLNPERILAARDLLRHGRSTCLEKSVAYAKERVVFKDTPIGSLPVDSPTRSPKQDTRHEAVKLMMYKRRLVLRSGPRPARASAPESTMAKFLGADLALKAVDAALETHGGNGFSPRTTASSISGSAPASVQDGPAVPRNDPELRQRTNLGLPRSY